MVVVEEQDSYYSDSDSDDEDVERYVFLARQPAPAGRHAEDDDDRDASSANDDDDGDGGDDGTVGLELIIALPMAAQTTPPNGSESSSSPRAGTESGGEGGQEKAHVHRAPREHGGDAKNATKKKRAACGNKRSRSPGGEADGDRDGVAAAAAAAKSAGASSSGATATSGRFPCSLCDRCFDSHQALGGHVLGHRKRTKIAIAAAGAVLDAVDAREEPDAVGVTQEAGKNIAQANKKVLVAARRVRANGDGMSDDGKTTVDDAPAERGDEDVDRARHKRQRKVHGKGNGGGVREPVFAGSHDDANCHDMKMDIGMASPKQKVGGAGTCQDGANGNGNGNVYKCKVCGMECFSGRALGGHMRKHRKRPPVGGGGGGGGSGGEGEEERSSSPATDDDDDCLQIPLAQLFGAETTC